MDPTVMAAAIGVGGTVIVGLAGFWATVRATGKTIQAARDSRIWDRRAKVYVDVIAALGYRRIQREHDLWTGSGTLDDDYERYAVAYLADSAQPKWPALESRLEAFGSQPVITGVGACTRAHVSATAAFQTWQNAKASIAQGIIPVEPEPVSPGQAAVNLRLAAEDAKWAASKADADVIQRIREELQGKGHPLGQ
jgi:hypothetical protein